MDGKFLLITIETGLSNALEKSIFSSFEDCEKEIERHMFYYNENYEDAFNRQEKKEENITKITYEYSCDYLDITFIIVEM